MSGRIRLKPAVRAATFEPEKFEDRYDEALTELINAKRKRQFLVSPAILLPKSPGGASTLRPQTGLPAIGCIL
jgi:hypothetical protein